MAKPRRRSELRVSSKHKPGTMIRSRSRCLRFTTYLCGWGSDVAGRGFDMIYVDREPATRQESDWVGALKTRLKPGGRLMVDDELVYRA